MGNNNQCWSFDLETNSIITLQNLVNYKWSAFVNKFNTTLFIFENIFFEKINFKGKGFKLTFKKNKKYINFMFGHSHLNLIFLKKLKIKRLNKYKYVLKSKNKIKLNKITQTICDVKPLNMYTKRGLRKNRQFFVKRKGKKSTYI